MTIKIAIAGARGRMGTAAVQAINEASDMELVAILDYKYEGMYLHGSDVTDTPGGVPIYETLESLTADTLPDVLLELTNPDAVYKNMHDALTYGIRPVVGTSGLSLKSISQLAELADEKRIGGIIAPNFSIGAVLMMKFSAMAARYLNDVEIIEMHHDQKIDAPSGTAMKTAEMIMDVREPHCQGHPGEKETEEGARGADIDGMKIHSVRLPGFLAHQQVLLGAPGEMLTIRHDSFDRKCFMPGVLLAIREVMKKESLIYGLENIIE
ncbi:4-hydroxy-tetrahydrodipicolinate reductase [Sporosarcina sp. G11-34]|uniref:4-hydroxy-tetrahydrodipicolinate reductase n=1 Tax=Sporosarcina sp. G11-34 TaxID=2849605 RepID=UPI0022A955C4|nr:4-hydroxy-tetrahydrodipicolinate reductase [Sporosarcina sp. G11-34]MCZ2259446.1 4-hydroxy-tetrahydrodipicolinate reductase [Sporosarcina sp. G11-34]